MVEVVRIANMIVYGRVVAKRNVPVEELIAFMAAKRRFVLY